MTSGLPSPSSDGDHHGHKAAPHHQDPATHALKPSNGRSKVHKTPHHRPIKRASSLRTQDAAGLAAGEVKGEQVKSEKLEGTGAGKAGGSGSASASGSGRAGVGPDGRHKRVWKACERCRMKKTKCDGESPCKRCKDDGLVCTAGSRKKAEFKQLPRGYAEVLEATQYALIATVHKLYAMVRANEPWTLSEPQLNDRGQPVIHNIAEALGCIRPNPDMPVVFPENSVEFEKLQRRLQAEELAAAGLAQQIGREHRAGSSESEHSDVFGDFASTFSIGGGSVPSTERTSPLLTSPTTCTPFVTNNTTSTSSTTNTNSTLPHLTSSPSSRPFRAVPTPLSIPASLPSSTSATVPPSTTISATSASSFSDTSPFGLSAADAFGSLGLDIEGFDPMGELDFNDFSLNGTGEMEDLNGVSIFDDGAFDLLGQVARWGTGKSDDWSSGGQFTLSSSKALKSQGRLMRSNPTGMTTAFNMGFVGNAMVRANTMPTATGLNETLGAGLGQGAFGGRLDEGFDGIGLGMVGMGSGPFMGAAGEQ